MELYFSFLSVSSFKTEELDSRKIRSFFELLLTSGKCFYLIQVYIWTNLKEGEKELFVFSQNSSSKWFPSLESLIYKAVDSLYFSESFSSGKIKIKQNYRRRNVSSSLFLRTIGSKYTGRYF